MTDYKELEALAWFVIGKDIAIAEAIIKSKGFEVEIKKWELPYVSPTIIKYNKIVLFHNSGDKIISAKLG